MSGAKSVIVTTCATLSALALVALVAIHMLWWTESRREPRYEYKVIAVQSEGTIAPATRR